MIEAEGADIIGGDVALSERLRYLCHDTALIYEEDGMESVESEPQLSVFQSACSGKTRSVVHLTKTQRLPPDSDHPPQLPRGAGEQKVSRETTDERLKTWFLPSNTLFAFRLICN